MGFGADGRRRGVYVHYVSDTHERYRARPAGPHATSPVGVGVPVSGC